MSLFNYFESSYLFYSNCHSLCLCSITVSGYGEGNGVATDFSGALNVDSIINLVLAVPR